MEMRITGAETATARGMTMNTRNVVLAVLCLVAAPASADPISGYVKADGTVAIPSSLYAVTHQGVGRYKIVFTPSLTPTASCMVTPIGRIHVRKLSESASQCSVVLFSNFQGYGDTDGDFSFIAVPMSN